MELNVLAAESGRLSNSLKNVSILSNSYVLHTVLLEVTVKSQLFSQAFKETKNPSTFVPQNQSQAVRLNDIVAEE